VDADVPSAGRDVGLERRPLRGRQDLAGREQPDDQPVPRQALRREHGRILRGVDDETGRRRDLLDGQDRGRDGFVPVARRPGEDEDLDGRRPGGGHDEAVCSRGAAGDQSGTTRASSVRSRCIEKNSE
jgi:hypothetical protein